LRIMSIIYYIALVSTVSELSSMCLSFMYICCLYMIVDDSWDNSHTTRYPLPLIYNTYLATGNMTNEDVMRATRNNLRKHRNKNRHGLNGITMDTWRYKVTKEEKEMYGLMGKFLWWKKTSRS